MNNIFLRKTWREFWGQRSRSLLIVLSLAVGLAAVGATGGARAILDQQMTASMREINAAHFLVNVMEVNDAQLESLRQMPEVARVEGRSTLAARAAVTDAKGNITWRNLTLYAAPNYADWTMDIVQPQQGDWPPAPGSVVLERGTLSFLDVQPGEALRLQTPQGSASDLNISGVGHDLYQVNPMIAAGGAGYVTADTLQALGGPQGYTELHIQLHPEYISQAGQVEKDIRRALESRGVSILGLDVLANGGHPLAGLVQGVVLVLGLMGGLALFLSGFLVVNTMKALLLEQTRQIGVLKAIGAHRGQIAALYLPLAGLMGSAALLAAVPLGGLGARGLSSVIAGLLNIDLTDARQAIGIIALQIGLGLVVPLLAALWPTLSAARHTVQSALTSYGLGGAAYGQGWLDRLTALPGASIVLRMAVRNALRRKQRLAFTLATLTLASGIAISIFSVQSATRQTLADLRSFFKHDLYIQFSRSVPIEPMLAAVSQFSDVVNAEAWAIAPAYISSETLDEPVAFWAVPPDTSMLMPKLTAGRWLQTGDVDAVVIDTHLLSDYPQLRVGDRLSMIVHGRATEWTIVGIFQTVPNRIRPTAEVYVPYETYAQRTQTQGFANQVWVQGREHTALSQARLMTELDQHLKSLGMASDWAVTGEELNTSFATAFNILIVFLLVMAGLLGFVGGLGLMGMIALNVLERRRELGMLRAVGAGSGMLRRILAVESIFIALLAWVGGVLLALPLSAGMCTLVGLAFLNAPFAFSFSFSGALLWLAVIILLAVFASLLPARRAVRLPVAEVLAYE